MGVVVDEWGWWLIRWKSYKNTAISRTKKNIEIYENRMLSVIKVGIKPTK